MNANDFSSGSLPLSQLPWVARGFVTMLARLKAGSLTLIDPQGRSQLFGHQGAWPHAQLHIRNWRAVGRILRQGDVGFADAYRRGWIECTDLQALFRLALRNEDSVAAIHGSRWALLFKRLVHWVLRDNNRRGSRRNILAHYDLGNEFYRLWLDPSMSYSAAIFDAKEHSDLEAAQWAKYDRLLDSIDAKPGQSVLEIGCGWGGFAQRAAERGLQVTGITLSDAQLAWAQNRIAQAGLTDRVSLSICDYRDVNGQFDHIVSIEMFEAVGLRHWPGFFAKVKACLRPSGKVAIQTIDIADDRFDAYVKSTDFIQQFIFPGGMLPSPSRFSALAADAGLAEQDRFSFGVDYAQTLNLWMAKFEESLPAVQALGFDESFIRIWRMYLAYCEAGFHEQRTDVKQWLFTHTSP
jgi:cyclopropane-fatty-acyl-phospholipid synthase